MEDKSKARYLISSRTAEEKAGFLQELAGGKNALRLNQALEAVAFGCGFNEWRELVAINAKLEAGEANSLGISALMLANDQHVDADTLSARHALQMEAVRGVITCSHARAHELMMQWALSRSTHGSETFAAETHSGEGNDEAGRSLPGGDSEPALEAALDDALFAAAQESRPDEAPYAQPSIPAAPVAVTYKKRRRA
ncbi:hypothetical protein AWB75_02220 [Caballeronia catudaia]|uniref:Uncharacterized protein n=1 Tax=Caballeronia catudaia TaxID=1777136 RepID=A0A158AK44_9BURK|nr:hypothetical protein [Caballeronia catudaia]SAK57437.1 hypothetical protein AWB75_02220 [Caballeronia catudaia]